MDTLVEENSPLEDIAIKRHYRHFPEFIRQNSDRSVELNTDIDEAHNSNSLSSRRASSVIAALRRPSQAFALSAAHAAMNYRRYLMSLFQTQAEHQFHIEDSDADKEKKLKKLHRKVGGDALTTILSALYAKLVVVLGIAFPITETISADVHPFYYQGFYLYLYLGSIAFVTYMYLSLMRERAVSSNTTSHRLRTNTFTTERTSTAPHGYHRPKRYGSFYLRLGAIAFGIGSMVYSGLEFGLYFELKNTIDCYSNVLQAITPTTRMILTLIQIQFVFLNSKDIELERHKIVSRFGMMHMIATNLCEWLYVLVEETKHEIVHLGNKGNHSKSTNSGGDLNHSKHCNDQGRVMGTLVNNARPFLFPCTIEYSLICAVILYEMWKALNTRKLPDITQSRPSSKKSFFHYDKHTLGSIFGHLTRQSEHHISLDCSHAHKGLFAGIFVIVLTIISLIMFFVLNKEAGAQDKDIYYRKHAEFEVNIVELVLHIISIVTVIAAMVQMRNLKYDHKAAAASGGHGLDITLLVVAQTGVFIYSMFSIIGFFFTLSENSPVGFVAEIFSFVQTFLQTMFVLDGWWRRCRNLQQTKEKPGRELVTFLLIANMALWTINAMEKSKAEFRPTHITFFGAWAWTIITHISMPLAIFYRFHSTICLFEIWKSAYKVKSPFANNILLSHQ